LRTLSPTIRCTQMARRTNTCVGETRTCLTPLARATVAFWRRRRAYRRRWDGGTREGAADGGGGGKGDRGSQSIAARGGMQAKLGDEASYRMSAGEGRRVGHLLYAF
jgi:hypothetical protein